MLFVLSAPSGSGKTTIAHSILQQFPSLRFSVSATTRPRRPREVEGNDYFFLSREEFERRIAGDELVEWEEIYGNLYGTLKSQAETALGEDSHMLFDIDVKGALAIKSLYGDTAVLVFIQPPSLHVLRERLVRRGTDNEDTIEKRMQRASWELDQAAAFDHLVVNDDLARSIPAVARIISSYMHKNIS